MLHVYFHRQRMMEKLGIQSVAGLTRYAIREGLTGLLAAEASAEKEEHGAALVVGG